MAQQYIVAARQSSASRRFPWLGRPESLVTKRLHICTLALSWFATYRGAAREVAGPSVAAGPEGYRAPRPIVFFSLMIPGLA